MRSLTARDERGSALVMTLVFVAVFGILIAAILGLAEVNLKTTSVVRGKDAKLYGADGGIDLGIQLIRDDTSGLYCPGPAFGQRTILEETINGRNVSVSCHAVQGLIGGGGGPDGRYAVIATQPGTAKKKGNSTTFDPPASITTMAGVGGGGFLISGGPVWAAGELDLPTALTTDGGDFTRRFDTCPQPPQSNLTVRAPHNLLCSTGATPDPDHVLPASPPATAPSPTSDGDCKVFFPGTYTNANKPSFLTGSTNANYLRSGIYYFEDIGLLDIKNNTNVVGGFPNLIAPKLGNIGPCADEQAADPVANGSGVMIVLGGTSRIEVQNSDVELFSRFGNPSGVTNGITIYGPATSQGGWKASSPPSNSPLFDAGAAADSRTVVHGRVYAPSSLVHAFASHPTLGSFLGGVVVGKLLLKASNPGQGNLAVGVEASPTETARVIKITATAEGVKAGEAAVTLQAIVEVADDAARTTTIRSWRVV